MKRNMDIIRLILLALEGDDEAGLKSHVEYSNQELAYNANLMVEAGFVDGAISNDNEGMPAHFHLVRMTWKGHDFLDAMRDETIWKKAKDTILKPFGGVVFEVLKEWLKMEARKQIGLPEVDSSS